MSLEATPISKDTQFNSASNPIYAAISGDVNVDVNSANGTCLIGKTSGGDFTTVYASATTITIGTVPYGHTFIDEDIVSIMQIAADGSVTNTYTRDDKAMSVAGSVITVTGATFTNTDTFIIFTCIPRRIYIDQTTPGTTNNVYITTMKPDGTNIMPSLDNVARAGFIKITDGTETASVNASNQLETAEANSGAIKTAIELIDDAIAAEGAAATKGIQISLDDGTDTQFAQCDSDGNLKTTAQFSGDVYVKTMTMAADTATRFETTTIKLKDFAIKVLINNALLGDSSNQTFPVDVGEVLGGTLIDLQDLYFKNATAGQNMVIHIIGTKV